MVWKNSAVEEVRKRVELLGEAVNKLQKGNNFRHTGGAKAPRCKTTSQNYGINTKKLEEKRAPDIKNQVETHGL